MKVQVRMRVPEKEIQACNNCLNITRELDDDYYNFSSNMLYVLKQFNLDIDGLSWDMSSSDAEKFCHVYHLKRTVNGKLVHTNYYLGITSRYYTGDVVGCAIVPAE